MVGEEDAFIAAAATTANSQEAQEGVQDSARRFTGFVKSNFDPRNPKHGKSCGNCR